MATVTVKLYTALKERIGKEKVAVDGAHVAQVLARLAEQIGDARGALFDDSGKVLSRFTLCLNTRMLSPRDFAVTEVQDGDTLHIMPPIAGG